MALAQGRNYMANHQVAPQIIQGTPNYNVEVAEGQVPPGEWYPAGWLPVVQSENRLAGSGYVLMPGKVVSLDGDKRLVPSGLADDMKVAQVGPDVNATTNSAGLSTYTSLDEEFGVVTKLNTFAKNGDDIGTANGFDIAGLNNGHLFTEPVGIMRYASLMAPGTDPSDPSTFTKHAYDTGGSRAFTRYCYIQVPLVEKAVRTETVKAGQVNHRITLYPDATPVVQNVGGGGTLTFRAVASMMSAPASGDIADQFTMVGRTILFNGKLSVDKEIVYTPIIKTPFSCLTMETAQTAGIGATMKTLLGGSVTYDANSNFVLNGASNDIIVGAKNIGRILDVKLGVNDDLKLVRSYFRDFGLWSEQPGSATDGRNTQLSIVNAPTYMVRIAINFPGAGL